MLQKALDWYHQAVFMGQPASFWFWLIAVGAVNDAVQRWPKLRAMSLFQLPFNALKMTPLARMPGIGPMLEAFDTPEPVKAVVGPPPQP